MFLELLFFISLLFLFYIYVGYSLLICLIAKTKVNSLLFSLEQQANRATLGVTVYFSAYNEAEQVEERMENILQQNYPPELVEIIALSDGSTDKTVKKLQNIAQKYQERDIRIVEFKDNAGKARAQNEVALMAKYDILVSTDAATTFPPNILNELTAPFAIATVGVVSGVVIYEIQQHGESLGKSYSSYRKLETSMRDCEARLGLGVKTDAICVAYRKNIWQKIEEWEDVDQVITIFAKKKGYYTVQANKAICFDKANKTKKQEIKQRTRMTRKALLSTFGQWKLPDFFRYPGFSFVLMSHKIIRFFSPLFFLLLISSGILLSIKYSFGVTALTIFFILIATLSIAYIFNIKSVKTLIGYLSSLIYANIAFALGIIEWIRGIKKGVYKPTRFFE